MWRRLTLFPFRKSSSLATLFVLRRTISSSSDFGVLNENELFANVEEEEGESLLFSENTKAKTKTSSTLPPETPVPTSVTTVVTELDSDALGTHLCAMAIMARRSERSTQLEELLKEVTRRTKLPQKTPQRIDSLGNLLDLVERLSFVGRPLPVIATDASQEEENTTVAAAESFRLSVRDRCLSEASESLLPDLIPPSTEGFGKNKDINSFTSAMPAQLAARSILVMSLCGFRRRDVDLFRALGLSLQSSLGQITHPHTLCFVLSALQHARIRPPTAFVEAICRRLPVLAKRTPLASWVAYRTFMVLHAGSYQGGLGPYRLMADTLYKCVYSDKPKAKAPLSEDDDLFESDGGVSEEALAILDAVRQGEDDATSTVLAATAASLTEGPLQNIKDEVSVMQSAVARSPIASVVRPSWHSQQTSSTVSAITLKYVNPHEDAFVKQVGIPSRHFTRLLLLLGLKRAPRQQYLRPIAKDVLEPMVPHLSPASFSRLLRALRLFGSEEVALINACVKRVVTAAATSLSESPLAVSEGTVSSTPVLLLGDTMDLLRILCTPSTPFQSVDRITGESLRLSVSPLFQVCHQIFTRDDSALRPSDMLNVTGDLLAMKRKLAQAVADGLADSQLNGKEQRRTSDEAFVDDLKLLANVEAKQQEQLSTEETSNPTTNTSVNDESERTESLAVAVEQSLLALSRVVIRFAQRLADFMDLAILPLTNAEMMLELCRELDPPDPQGKLHLLKQARQRVNEDPGDDEYYSVIDVDVRDVFARIQGINGSYAWRSHRPINAIAITSFKALLAFHPIDILLSAVHLHEQSYPGGLMMALRRVLCRFIFDKVILEYNVITGVCPAPPSPPEPKLELIPLRKRWGETMERGKLTNSSSSESSPWVSPWKEDTKIKEDGPTWRVFSPYDVIDRTYTPLLLSLEGLERVMNLIEATVPAIGSGIQDNDITWRLLLKKLETIKESSENTAKLTKRCQQQLTRLEESKEAEPLGKEKISMSFFS